MMTPGYQRDGRETDGLRFLRSEHETTQRSSGGQTEKPLPGTVLSGETKTGQHKERSL